MARHSSPGGHSGEAGLFLPMAALRAAAGGGCAIIGRAACSRH